MTQHIKILVGMPAIESSEKIEICIQEKSFFLENKSAHTVGFEFTVIYGEHPSILVSKKLETLLKLDSFQGDTSSMFLVEKSGTLSLKSPFMQNNMDSIHKLIDSWVLYVVLYMTQGIPFQKFASFEAYKNDAHKLYKDLGVSFEKKIE